MQVYTKTTPQTEWLNQAIDEITAASSQACTEPGRSGYVYLIHLHHPLGQPQTAHQRAQHGLPPRQQPYTSHAQHYIGWCSNLAARIQAHQLGRGSKLLAAAHRQGIPFHIVRAWHSGPDFERTLKRRKESPRLCPICGPATGIFPSELTQEEITNALIPF